MLDTEIPPKQDLSPSAVSTSHEDKSDWWRHITRDCSKFILLIFEIMLTYQFFFCVLHFTTSFYRRRIKWESSFQLELKRIKRITIVIVYHGFRLSEKWHRILPYFSTRQRKSEPPIKTPWNYIFTPESCSWNKVGSKRQEGGKGCEIKRW